MAISHSKFGFSVALALVFGLAGSAFGQSSLVPAIFEVPAPPAPDVSEFADETAPTDFFSYKNPPGDAAPIKDVLKYWEYWNRLNPNTRFSPLPSVATAERILAEIDRDFSIADDFLNVLSKVPGAGETILRIYADEAKRDELPSYRHGTIKRWLATNSKAEIDVLEAASKAIRDTPTYLTNHSSLLSLARIDWERARPIAESLANNDEQPVSQTLGRWVLYRRAMQRGESNEAASLRRLLQDTVSDADAKPGNRDLAIDALAKSGDFDGLDEWYLSLFDDESLYELRVGRSLYTGLTTLVTYSPPDRFVEPMAERVSTRNKRLRAAVTRNLGLMLANKNPKVVRALLPWLEDPEWSVEYNGERADLVETLSSTPVPESVPGLIAMANEMTETVASEIEPDEPNKAESVRTAKLLTARAREKAYDIRLRIVKALGYQRDIRAAQTLQRLLPLTRRDDRDDLVRAIYMSGGYSPEFQVSALETAARALAPALKKSSEETDARLKSFDPAERFKKIKISDTPGSSESTSPSGVITALPKVVGISAGGGFSDSLFEFRQPEPFVPAEVIPHLALGIQENKLHEILFLNLLAGRIKELEKREWFVAAALRSYMLQWEGKSVHTILLSDLAEGKGTIAGVVRLLASRKSIVRENPDALASLLNSRSAEARSVGVCISENQQAAARILASGDSIAIDTLLGCARLIRLELPLEKTAGLLESDDKMLVLAASRYLESVDSPASRVALWASAPDQAWILGPRRNYFQPGGEISVDPELIIRLYESVGHPPGYYDQWDIYGLDMRLDLAEEKIREQLVQDDKLLGIYWFDGTSIKVFEDYVELMWEKDPARYRTRRLTQEEFAAFKSIISSEQILNGGPYFGECGACVEHQLILAGRVGGRRVFFETGNPPQVLIELQSLFKALKEPEATLKYWAEKRVPGLSVVFADKRLDVISIVGSGNNRLVLLKDHLRAEEIDVEIQKLWQTDLYNSELTYEEAASRLEERMKALTLEPFSWRVLDKSGVGEVTSPPEGWTVAQNSLFSGFEDPESSTSNGTISLTANAIGLMLERNADTSLIAEGVYKKPVLDKSGRWALVNSADDGDNPLMKLDIRQNKIVKIAVPDNRKFAVADTYLPQIGKFLVLVGDKMTKYGFFVVKPERYLYDPETGSFKKLEGIVQPLLDIGNGELQPAGNNTFWAALIKEKGTSVGHYSLGDLSFKEQVFIPWILFSTEKMVVEEGGTTAFVIYNKQLLRIPIVGKSEDSK